MIFFLTLSTWAKADCPFGTYFDVVRGDCADCSLECQTCTSPGDDVSMNCIECSDRFKVTLNGNCLYPCQIVGKCDICGNKCKICAPTKCEVCFSPYLLMFPGCVEACPYGYYSDGVQCLECDQSCEGCTGGGSSKCKSCKAGLESINGLCTIGYCGDGAITGNEECDDAVDSNCFNCQIVNCQENEYWGSNTCLECDESCSTCFAEGNQNCFLCSSNFSSINGSCLKNTCGDGVVGPGEECDEVSDTCQECKIVSCFSPTILSTHFSSDFTSIKTEFNQTVMCSDCRILKDYEVLGTDPICYCSARTLFISLGRNFKLNQNTKLEILPSTLSPCNSPMDLEVKGSDSSFSVKIFPNQGTLTCNNYFYLSSKLESKILDPVVEFEWETEPENFMIQEYLYSLNPTIPMHLLQGSDIKFMLKVYNFLGDFAMSEYLGSFSQVSNLTIDIDEWVKVDREHEIFLRAELKGCEKFKESFFDWEVVDDDKTKIEKYGKIVKVLNKDYDSGNFIRIRVKAWTEKNKSTEKIITLEYQSSDIEAVIDKRCINSMEQSVVINAKLSKYAGKYEDMDFNWVISSQNQFIRNESTPEITILNDRSEYNIELTVSKSGVTDKDEVTLKFSDHNSWISSETLKMKNSKDLYFYKNDNSSYWISNLESNSSKFSQYARFQTDQTVKDPWVGTSQNCKIKLKKPALPIPGALQVYPNEGVAWKTEFTLKATGWSGGYLYEFWYMSSDKYIRLTDLIYSESFTTILPYSSHLKVKVRVYTINRNYVEYETKVSIKENYENKTQSFNKALLGVQAHDFERQLQTGIVLIELVLQLGTQLNTENDNKIQLTEYSSIYSINDKERDVMISKLLQIMSSSSMYLPKNIQLDEMINDFVLKIIKSKKELSLKEIVSICLVLRKRYDDGLSLDSKTNLISIIYDLFKHPEHLKDSILFKELENLLIQIGLSLSSLKAFEPKSLFQNDKFILQSIKSSPGYFRSDYNSLSNLSYSILIVNSSNAGNFTIINYLDPSLVTLSNSSLLVQTNKNLQFNAIVSVPGFNPSSKAQCNSLNKSSSAIIKDSLTWCPLNSSDKFQLELSIIQAKKTTNKVKASFINIILVSIFILCNIIWITWGWLRDKKQHQTVFPELLQASSSSFFSAIKNCHSFINIFTRFEFGSPRPVRILIYDFKELFMILTIITLTPYFSLIPLIILSEMSYFCFGKLLALLLKKHERKSIKKLPDPPDLRYSPTIKLPELTAKTKYTYVRNFSESNPVSDTNFTYESSYRYHKPTALTGIGLGLGVSGAALRLIIIRRLDWWKEFLLVLALDHLVVQVLSIAVQHFGLKRFAMFRKIISKTMNDTSDHNSSSIA